MRTGGRAGGVRSGWMKGGTGSSARDQREEVLLAPLDVGHIERPRLAHTVGEAARGEVDGQHRALAAVAQRELDRDLARAGARAEDARALEVEGVACVRGAGR